MPLIAGVDGCRAGWVVVTEHDAFVRSDFPAVVAALPPDAVIAVDIPVGLLETFVPGGRDADRAARELLANQRSSVFSAPVRRAFGATTLREAQTRGCRMTLQALKIMPKVEEVDSSMSPILQHRVFEVHPEVSFRGMNDQRPLQSKKSRRGGRDERHALLIGVGITVPTRPRAGEKEDDLLDACAALWTARRIAAGTAERVPDAPPVDGRGLRMEICW